MVSRLNGRASLSIPSAALLACFICFAGCASARVPQAKRDTPAPAMLGSAIEVSAAYPDPKRPSRMLMTMTAGTVNGNLGNAPGETSGAITRLRAILYDKGVKSAVLTSPKAQTQDGGHTVWATGGVHIQSLTSPGTTLTANTIVWNSVAKTITAVGNVMYKDGKTGARLWGPAFQTDTKMVHFRTIKPSGLFLRKGF